MEPAHGPVPLPLTGGTRRHEDWFGRLRFAQGALAREVRAGETLALRAGMAAPVHLVESGLLALAVSSGSGGRCIVGIVGPGDLIGTAGLAEDEEAATSPVRVEAVALRPSRTLAIPAPELIRMVRADGGTAVSVVASLALRLAELEASLVRSGTLRLRDRCLALLGSLVRRWGRPSREGALIAFPLTQEDIADMVGATRESVNRALRDLSRQGLIRRSGRTYVVRSDGGREPG